MACALGSLFMEKGLAGFQTLQWHEICQQRTERGEPKDEPGAQYEHNSWQQERDVGSVHSQEDAPSRLIILVLEPFQHPCKDTEPLKKYIACEHDVPQCAASANKAH